MAEENLLKQAKREEQDTRLKLFSSIAICLFGTIILVLCVAFCNFEFPLYAKVLLVILGCISFVISLILATILDLKVGAFECKNCKHKFMPSVWAYLWGMHTITTRHLKCPKCGKRTFCKRILKNKKSD